MDNNMINENVIVDTIEIVNNDIIEIVDNDTIEIVDNEIDEMDIDESPIVVVNNTTVIDGELVDLDNIIDECLDIVDDDSDYDILHYIPDNELLNNFNCIIEYCKINIKPILYCGIFLYILNYLF